MKERCTWARSGTLWLTSLYLIFLPHVTAHKPGVIHINPEKGGEYCFLFPSQWMKSYQESNKTRNRWLNSEPWSQNLTYAAMCCHPSFFGEDGVDQGGFSTRITSVREGNCNLFENAKLIQINRTRGLLTLGGDAPYPKKNWKPGHNWGHCEEITIPGIVLNDLDILYLLFKNLIKDLLYKTGIIYLMSIAMVTIGSYWAGSREKKKLRYTEKPYQTDFGEITMDTNVYFTCTCAAVVTIMLLALYCFYDYLLHVMIAIFSLYASLSLYSCLTAFVSNIPFGKNIIRFPYFHKGLELRQLLLAILCLSVNATWIVFRNEKEWGWVLQDILGISIGIYILRTVHIPTLKNCSLFLLAHLFYDIVCLFISPFLTKTGRSITDVTTFGSSYLEEIPFMLKVPILSSTSMPEDNTFTAVGLGDIVLPGFLVVYCRRFDIQVDSSGVYFLASTLAYSYGLLLTFVAATFLQASQSTLLYLVPCILVTSLAVAASRKEVVSFWTGVGFANKLPKPSSAKVIKESGVSKGSIGLRRRGKEIMNTPIHKEELNDSSIELSNLKTDSDESNNYVQSYELDSQE